MPRGTTAAKRQQGAANQRDTRHENGLVGPGKRVQKQKSNGHLNGHAKSSEHNAPPPLPGTPPLTNGNARSTMPTDNNFPDLKMHGDNLRAASVSGDSEFSSAESSHNMPVISISQENHRRIDVNAAKNPAVHRDLGPLGFALTVLRSCPLYDTIAILIVLLQLPPTFLSLIHLLFATLTFVPPSNPAASALSFSFTDIFEGTMSTPSIASILLIDGLVLLIWIFLWSPLQNIALDLAQSVIALTLGGGASGRDAGLNNVMVCLGVIGANHLSHNGHVKHSGIRALLSSTSKGLIGSPDPDDPLENISHGVKRTTSHTWIRSILAIHILTQGIVRYVRDWLMRKKRDGSTAMDPEAGKSSTDANAESSGGGAQTASDTAASLPSNHAAVTAKKKKKQSAQVRLRQPLWSALASTKIVMVKEYETSHTAAESASTNATGTKDLGNAPFEKEADMIWITYVGPDEVYFSTSYFPAHSAPSSINKKWLEAGVDQTKPFFVRVNNTIWQPTRINISEESESSGNLKRWNGEIFGLAAMSSYHCEFISTTDGKTIFSSNVRTLPPADIAVGLAPTPAFSGRPNSPTTTLKTSIASSEAKLAEERIRQKKERKDQRAKLASLRKDIEKLSNSIASGGGNEDRQRQKHQQHLSHMKQAEETIAELNAEIENFESIPDDSHSQYAVHKRDFQRQRDQHKHSLKVFNESKAASEREIQALSNEVAVLQQKRERMQSRIAKLNGEHERITDANARGLDEVQRKEREREARQVERASLEMMLRERLSELSTKAMEKSGQLHALNGAVESLQQLELYSQAQHAQSPNASVPNLNAVLDNTIPENIAHNYPWNTGGYTSSPAFANTLMAAPAPRVRGRSSSMHSNISGFTQSSGEGPVPTLPHSASFPSNYPPGFGPQPPQSHSASKAELLEDSTADHDDPYENAHRKDSSGSSSGNGSVGDPKSPVQGNSTHVIGSGYMYQGYSGHGHGHVHGQHHENSGRVVKW